MAHKTPQFNIKTGSDSSLFFSREVTGSDVSAGEFIEDQIGLIKDKDVEESDVYVYPALTRRTGHSISGTTESIESQELRKGRTKSAPRKGNSSSEGSLDIELSPETYDDIFEAALRNKWTPWASDTNSAINFDKVECPELNFLSKGKTADGDMVPTLLIGTSEDAIIRVEKEADVASYEIDELTCGTEDIKYSALAQYGGITGEDLYQEFQHLAVNTLSLSVTPGQIVTGSFGFMGSNNPDLLQTGNSYVVADPQPTADNFGDKVYYKRTGAGTEGDPYVYAKAEAFDSDVADAKGYFDAPTGLIDYMAYKDADDEGRFVDQKKAEDVKAWVDELAFKTGTKTDQFTAREGFLYINGHRVQYGSNLTFELNNGLNRVFAIFEKDAISTSPLSLDITGSLNAYLIKGKSEDLYNMCTGDKDVEIVFCFQDKEDDPDYLYVMQIFKTKFTSSDISTGAQELEVTLPFTSFEERACRMFRIRRKAMALAFDPTGTLSVTLENPPKDDPAASDFIVTATKSDGTQITLTPGEYADGVMSYTFDGITGTADTITVSAQYDGKVKTKAYTVA